MASGSMPLQDDRAAWLRGVEAGSPRFSASSRGVHVKTPGHDENAADLPYFTVSSLKVESASRSCSL